MHRSNVSPIYAWKNLQHWALISFTIFPNVTDQLQHFGGILITMKLFSKYEADRMHMTTENRKGALCWGKPISSHLTHWPTKMQTANFCTSKIRTCLSRPLCVYAKATYIACKVCVPKSCSPSSWLHCLSSNMTLLSCQCIWSIKKN